MPDCDPALSGAAIRRCEFHTALCLRRIVAAYIAITVAISVTTTPPVPADAITLDTAFSAAGPPPRRPAPPPTRRPRPPTPHWTHPPDVETTCPIHGCALYPARPIPCPECEIEAEEQEADQ